MRNKIVLWASFAIMVIAQLGIPTQMINWYTTILKTGQEFKFLVEPIDPSDPFRGKYITLNFREDTVLAPLKSSWQKNDIIYVHLNKGEDGMAKIKTISKEKPSAVVPFIKAKVSYVNSEYGKNRILFLEYPFTRFFMEETKAPKAEKLYAGLSADTSQKAWALIKIKDGDGILKDVVINGKLISDLVK